MNWEVEGNMEASMSTKRHYSDMQIFVLFLFYFMLNNYLNLFNYIGCILFGTGIF